MSLSVCLYVCCKHRHLYQNQIFKIPITFYNARVNKVQGRSSLLTTLMTVDRSALTALLRSRMSLLCTLFLQLCSSWQDFVWYSVSCSLSAVLELLGYSWYRGNVQTPGPLVLWLSSKSIVLRHLSIAQVLWPVRTAGSSICAEVTCTVTRRLIVAEARPQTRNKHCSHGSIYCRPPPPGRVVCRYRGFADSSNVSCLSLVA